MNESEKTNYIIVLAAILVVVFGLIAVSSFNRQRLKKAPPMQSDIQEITTQSDSDSLESIEKDLIETDLTDIDKELQDIEKELDQAY